MLHALFFRSSKLKIFYIFAYAVEFDHNIQPQIEYTSSNKSDDAITKFNPRLNPVEVSPTQKTF